MAKQKVPSSRCRNCLVLIEAVKQTDGSFVMFNEDQTEHHCKALGAVYPDGLPGHNDTDTSAEAAVAVGERLRDKQLEVLGIVRRSERGATAHEVAALCPQPVQGVNSRTNELAKLGYIHDSGERRLGPHGKRVIVWKASQQTTV